MKILAITGSPRGMHGNTGLLTEALLAGVHAAGGRVELVHLKEMTVRPCVACDACHRDGRCILPDDLPELLDRLQHADGFVLSSPNYIFSVTAQLKAFFDRCCGPIHCQAFAGKYAVCVETSGGGEDNEVLHYMARFVNATGAWSVGGIGSRVAGWRAFPQQEELFDRARALGGELVAAIRAQRRYPEQEAGLRAFGDYMRNLIECMREQWPYEYDYWRQRDNG